MPTLCPRVGDLFPRVDARLLQNCAPPAEEAEWIGDFFETAHSDSLWTPSWEEGVCEHNAGDHDLFKKIRPPQQRARPYLSRGCGPGSVTALSLVGLPAAAAGGVCSAACPPSAEPLLAMDGLLSGTPPGAAGSAVEMQGSDLLEGSGW
ncbi:hypothetical protein EYF80_032598 [Liparis tanakae]|uniref:Uncharacterized protein n=1 Tax=Liparis tanakae TaxID=230148 RepID=A0A4Z2GU95_9TELE|nr:hypothetical protein EYF80_032598 [Liparis tanakae]